LIILSYILIVVKERERPAQSFRVGFGHSINPKLKKYFCSKGKSIFLGTFDMYGHNLVKEPNFQQGLSRTNLFSDLKMAVIIKKVLKKKSWVYRESNNT
jgi:hypothetical protein